MLDQWCSLSWNWFSHNSSYHLAASVGMSRDTVPAPGMLWAQPNSESQLQLSCSRPASSHSRGEPQFCIPTTVCQWLIYKSVNRFCGSSNQLTESWCHGIKESSVGLILAWPIPGWRTKGWYENSKQINMHIYWFPLFDFHFSFPPQFNSFSESSWGQYDCTDKGNMPKQKKTWNAAEISAELPGVLLTE